MLPPSWGRSAGTSPSRTHRLIVDADTPSSSAASLTVSHRVGFERVLVDITPHFTLICGWHPWITVSVRTPTDDCGVNDLERVRLVLEDHRRVGAEFDGAWLRAVGACRDRDMRHALIATAAAWEAAYCGRPSTRVEDAVTVLPGAS